MPEIALFMGKCMKRQFFKVGFYRNLHKNISKIQKNFMFTKFISNFVKRCYLILIKEIEI